jgi:hypothetical protein
MAHDTDNDDMFDESFDEDNDEDPWDMERELRGE